MRVCNATLENLTIEERPYLLGNRYTFHEVGICVCAIFGLLAILIAGWLIVQHARHYSMPTEQRHTMRILMMMPVYAIVSFLSYYYYTKAIYFDVLGDCWEAFAIASFFTLMCNYLRPNLHDQKQYFRDRQRPKNWIWPLPWLQKCTGGENRGPFRRPRNSLTWFNVIYLCVFQYCFIRVFFTIVSVITESTNRYCEDSLNPAFAHVWVTGFEGGSVSIAMYGLIQFYYELRGDLAQHKPFLKLLCIKLVIFLSFWQTLIISFLASSSHGLIKPGPRVGYQDIHVGIPALLLCIEMALFALLHLFAFPWRHPYASAAELEEHVALQNPKNVGTTGNDRFNAFSGETASVNGTRKRKPTEGKGPEPVYHGGRFGIKAWANALNPWDIIKQTARGFRWLFVGVRHRNDDLPMHLQQTPNLSSGGPVDAQGMPLGSAGNTNNNNITFQRPTDPNVPPPYPISPHLAPQPYSSSPYNEQRPASGNPYSSPPNGYDGSWSSSPIRQSAELHMPNGGREEADDRRGLLRYAAASAGRSREVS